MINSTQIQRTIVGVEFPNLGISNILAMYVHDTHLLIRAELRYVMAVKEILDVFAAASGLHFTISAWPGIILKLFWR